MFYYNIIFTVYVAGVIKTTGRKLDRENQAEHILEVSVPSRQNLLLILLLFQLFVWLFKY
jgi:hypothetical protein